MRDRIAALALLWITLVVPHASSQHVYWTNSPDVQRLRIGGSDVETIVGGSSGIDLPTAIAVTQQSLCWIDASNGIAIRLADLDGSDVRNLVGFDATAPTALDVDVAANRLYWTDRLAGIGRINFLDLASPQLITTVAVGGNPQGVAVDPATGAVYWCDAEIPFAGRIRRADPELEVIEDVLSSDLVRPSDIAIDAVAGLMYWTDLGSAPLVPGKIERAGLNGAGRAVQVNADDGLVEPQGIDVDSCSGKLYWSDRATDRIQRAGLVIPDGEAAGSRSDVEDLVTAGIPNVSFLAVQPERLPAPTTPDVECGTAEDPFHFGSGTPSGPPMLPGRAGGDDHGDPHGSVHRARLLADPCAADDLQAAAFTRHDTLPPVLHLAGAVRLVDQDCDGSEALPAPRATDLCDPAPHVAGPALLPAGTASSVRFTASDAAGNHTTREVDVRVAYGANLHVSVREIILGDSGVVAARPLHGADVYAVALASGAACSPDDEPCLTAAIDDPAIGTVLNHGITDAFGAVLLDVPPADLLIVAQAVAHDGATVIVGRLARGLRCGSTDALRLSHARRLATTPTPPRYAPDKTAPRAR